MLHLNNTKKLKKAVPWIILFILLLTTSFCYAHPGGLDSRGGHYVRTSGWGYPVGSYHYHRKPSSYRSAEYDPIPVAPEPIFAPKPIVMPEPIVVSKPIVVSEPILAPERSNPKSFITVERIILGGLIVAVLYLFSKKKQT